MCGIVGYIGYRPAVPVLLGGLRRLEYRGYDSAGVALADPTTGQLNTRRTVGPVDALCASLEGNSLLGNVGIGHTRWATHGRPTPANAHPHMDADNRLALVHNGIIENHAVLRTYLQDRGIVFRSETDTEVLTQLVGMLYRESGDFLASVQEALGEVRGTYGIAVLCADLPDTLVVARRGSPLILGLGDGEYFLASDATAIVAHTRQVAYMDDNEVIQLTPKSLHASTLDKQTVKKSFGSLQMTLDEIELGDCPHFMLKEIHEQPQSLQNTMRGRVQQGRDDVILGGLSNLERELSRCRRVLLFGCGTAWHAALIGEYLLEHVAGLPADVEYASELRYRNPIIEDGTLALAISQSGETADTLAALQEVQLKGATCLGVVNAVGSTIARETDAGIYLHVGPEIGVASTKAFLAQVTVLTMLSIYLGRRRQLAPQQARHLIDELARLPDKIEQVLACEPLIKRLALQLSEWDNWLYLGRGVNFPVALEGALKLKEISYIHAEGLPAAEMKHGPLALIDPGMPVIVIAPQDHTHDKVLANIEEVRCREGRVIALATEGDEEIARLTDEVIYVPRTLPILTPLLTSIPLQLLAYHTAVARGCNVDQPRNLAKSVTVE